MVLAEPSEEPHWSDWCGAGRRDSGCESGSISLAADVSLKSGPTVFISDANMVCLVLAEQNREQQHPETDSSHVYLSS